VAFIRNARKSGFISRGGVRRRETAWLGGVTVRSTLAAGSTSILQSSLNAAALASRPFTVIRVRGVMFVKSDQAAANEFQDVAYGNAVVSDQAVAIGVTAVPTPDTDDASDLWFVYKRILNEMLFSDATGINSPYGIFGEFDSKAMRKIEDGQDLVEVVETGPLSSGVVVTTYARTLIKLH